MINRRDLFIGACGAPYLLALQDASAAQTLQPKTQDVLLVMERETRNTLLDLFDDIEYLDMSYNDYPFTEKWEMVDDVHSVMWFEWKSLNDKIKWEDHEVLQGQR